MKIAVAGAGYAGLFVAPPLNLRSDKLNDGADRAYTRNPFRRD